MKFLIFLGNWGECSNSCGKNALYSQEENKLANLTERRKSLEEEIKKLEEELAKKKEGSND